MKKIFFTITMSAFLSFGVMSCGGSEKNDSDETTTEKTTEKGESDEGSESTDDASNEESTAGTDCEAWLDDYESFMDDYLVLLKKYQANPTDMTLMQEYTNMTQKAQSLSTTTPEDCAEDAAFAARLVEISNKMSAAAAGM